MDKPDRPCAPSPRPRHGPLDDKERLLRVEMEIEYLREHIDKIEMKVDGIRISVEGAIKSFNHDIRVTMDDLRERSIALSTAHAELASLVNRLQEDREIARRRERVLGTAVIVAILGLVAEILHNNLLGG